jgi:lactoylglutathione lyase
VSDRSEARVSLREVDAGNLHAVLRLAVSEAQRAFVAPNAWSLAEAHFHPEAWFRAIYADETPVGFLMLHDEELLPTPRQRGFYLLWRLMVDARHQGLGYGRRALGLLVDHVRTRPRAQTLLASCLPGPGSPEPFYRRLGFRPTGREVHGEIELALPLPAPAGTASGLAGSGVAQPMERDGRVAQLLVNVDVGELEPGIRFYAAALGLRLARRLGPDIAELEGASVPVYLTAHAPGSRPFEGATRPREYRRHWTPVHLDLVVPELEPALQRAQGAGASREGPIREFSWGRYAVLADPFGNGFCILQFEGRAYAELASEPSG